MPIISLFNHKGGVSKTTTTFNLGWMLAKNGHKTLMVDTDPQCNLTALVFGYNEIQSFDKIYEDNKHCDIYSCISPVFDGKLEGVIPGEPIQTTNPDLWLMCGNLELSAIETQLSVALTTSSTIQAISSMPGCLRAFLDETRKKHDFEYILIDMSPSVGALNECLLMGSDYFIVPTAPDFFCGQAIQSLARVIPEWDKQINEFRRTNIRYPIPKIPPKFIGILSQKYRPRKGMPARAFREWIDKIGQEVANRLIPALTQSNMLIYSECLESDSNGFPPYNLANISDFNSLIAISQDCGKPIYELTEDEIDRSGSVLDNMVISRDEFEKVFSTLATKIHEVISKCS